MKKLVLAIGVLSGALAGTLVSGTASAYDSVNQGLYRISPKLAPHKSLDLPGYCPGYNSPNWFPGQLGIFHYDGYNCNAPAADQKWYISYAGSDGNGPYYTIYQGTNGSPACLDVSGGPFSGPVGHIGTWACNGGAWQQWYFQQVEPGNGGSLYGHWKIASRYNTGFVLDLGNCNTDNGNNVGLWYDNSNTCNQHWSEVTGQTVSDGQEWVLMRADWDMPVEDWSDDFSSGGGNNGLGGSWNVMSFGAGRFNGELENYSNSTSYVYQQNNTLHIDAHNTGGGCTGMGCFTSGRINTKNRATYQNGAWSASFHYWQDNNANHGAWPAVWLLGNGNAEDQYNSSVAWTSACGNTDNWPTYGSREIDFGEWFNNVNAWANGGRGTSASYTTNLIENGACNSYNSDWNSSGQNFNPQNWVTFKVQFDENVGPGNHINFYRNGNYMGGGPMDNFYNQPMFAIVNLAIGGNGGGDASGFGVNNWASIQLDWIAHERWCTGAAMNAGSC